MSDKTAEWQRLYLSPIVYEALVAEGHNPHALCARGTEYHGNAYDFVKPFVIVHPQGGGVDLNRLGLVLYINKDENDKKFNHTLELDAIKIPTAIIATMPGRRLDTIVEIQGAEGYLIRSVEVKSPDTADNILYVIHLDICSEYIETQKGKIKKHYCFENDNSPDTNRDNTLN